MVGQLRMEGLAVIRFALLIIALATFTADGASQQMLMRRAWASRGVGASAFSPLSLSPKVWIDASDTTTISTTSSNTVSGWADKSGNGFNLAQATGSKQPIYSNAVFNSLNCVAFNNAQAMQFTNLVVSATNYTIFVAFRGRATDSLIHDLFDAQTGRLLLWQYQTPNNCAFAYLAGATYNTSIASPTNGACILTWDLGASPNVYLNGTAIGSSPGYTQTAIGGTVILGSRYSSDQAYLHGDIGEFILYAYTLPASDRSNVWSYLKAKWGTP